MTLWSSDFARRIEAPSRAQLVLWTVPWCPPCNEMQGTVFDDPLFRDAAPDAVELVRIDGDAPGAQRVGEALSLAGYPTMLLRNAGGQEVLRLPHALPVAPFVAIVERAARSSTPLAATIAHVAAGNRPDGDALAILAHHAWYQDEVALAGRDAPAFFAGLHAQAQGVERLRLACAWARAASQSPSRDGAAAALIEALRNPACSYHVAGPIVVAPLPTVLSLSDEGSSLRADLVQAWTVMLERALADAASSPTERLIAGSGLLQMAEPAEVQALRPRLAALVSEILMAARTPVERQTTVNMAGHLLRAAGYEGLAYAVFEAEAMRAEHGSYFMPYLADIAKARGDAATARTWWLRAFETAFGCVTRFQLGVRYVSGLASLGAAAPELEAAADTVLRELRGQSGFFYGRAHDSLRQLVAVAGPVPVLRDLAGEDADVISRGRIRIAAAA